MVLKSVCQVVHTKQKSVQKQRKVSLIETKQSGLDKWKPKMSTRWKPKHKGRLKYKVFNMCVCVHAYKCMYVYK